MTKEEYRELIIDAVKTLKIDYEDFIGYTFSDDPKIWLENIHKIFPDTYTYSKLKKDEITGFTLLNKKGLLEQLLDNFTLSLSYIFNINLGIL